MRRSVVNVLIVALALAMGPRMTHAQVTTNPPGVVNPSPGLTSPNPNPPAEVYRPPPIRRAPTTVPGFPDVPPLPQRQAVPKVPNAPPKIESFVDRAARCAHHGTSFGVPAGQIGQYTRGCAQ